MATGFQETVHDLHLHELFEKSEFISRGPPSRYCLITTRSSLNEDGLIRKWTFGQQDINMENKIILMVGETGTGKTTLINSLVNYILGVKFTDHIWFEITDEREDHQTANQMLDQTQSQTNKITVYEVFPQYSPVSLTIIDTPGYGATNGAQFDEKVAVYLYKLFTHETGVKEIDAVCLVVKASENRLSDRQHYIFDAVLSLFGKDIKNNIVIFVTHSDGLFPKNAINAIKTAKLPCRKSKANNPDYFLFNNYDIDEDSAGNDEEQLQRFWKMKEDSFETFLGTLEKQNRKSLDQTKSLMTERARLKACISNLHHRIEFTEKKKDEQIQIQKAIHENKDKIMNRENFTFQITKCHKNKVLITHASWWDRKVTYCNVCEENCHEYNCWCAPTAEFCCVMKNGHCTVCKHKCHYTKHNKENMKYVTICTGEAIDYNSLKRLSESQDDAATGIEFDLKRYENVKNDIENKKKEEIEMLKMEKVLQEALSSLENEKIRLVKEAYDTLQKLCEIALQPDSAYIVESLDFLIPRAEETGLRSCADRLKELRKLDTVAEGKAYAALRYLKGGVDKMSSFVPHKK